MNPADGPSWRLDYEPLEGENELLLPTLQLKLRVNSAFKEIHMGDDMDVDSPARPKFKRDKGERYWLNIDEMSTTIPVVGKEKSTDELVDAATWKLDALRL